MFEVAQLGCGLSTFLRRVFRETRCGIKEARFSLIGVLP